MKIFLTVPMVAPSLNKFYAGMHYIQRSKLAREWHSMVAIIVKKENLKPITEYPVTILTKRFTKSKRLLDCSNCCMANKLIEDGLVKAGILVNDTPRYVARSIQDRPVGGADSDYTMAFIKPFDKFYLDINPICRSQQRRVKIQKG